MSTLFENFTESPGQPPEPQKCVAPRKRQRGEDAELDAILEEQRNIELMQFDILRIKSPMERHSAWSCLTEEAVKLALSGPTQASKRLGLKVLLMMAGQKDEVARKTRAWEGGE